MDSRPNLQALFEELLGSRNVYFQPPASVKMRYPAIVYSRKNIETRYADNFAYMRLPCYEVILIDPNPDSEYAYKILDIQYSSFDRHYEADNLNHDVFTVYF